MRTNIQLPSFHGFYESIWSYHADDIIEEDFRERGIIHGGDWDCHWREYEKEIVDNYTQMYIDLVNSTFDFELKQIGDAELYSPRYYNYETDRIYVDVEFTGIIRLRMKMREHEDELRKLIKEHHTSYDGFISFMSNDFDEWLDEYLKYGNKEFGLYLSYALYYLVWLETGKEDLDARFYEWICEDVYAEWYPNSEESKAELEKVEAVESVFGWGAYDSEKWENVDVEEVKRQMEEIKFDREHQGKLF